MAEQDRAIGGSRMYRRKLLLYIARKEYQNIFAKFITKWPQFLLHGMFRFHQLPSAVIISRSLQPNAQVTSDATLALTTTFFCQPTTFVSQSSAALRQFPDTSASPSNIFNVTMTGKSNRSSLWTFLNWYGLSLLSLQDVLATCNQTACIPVPVLTAYLFPLCVGLRDRPISLTVSSFIHDKWSIRSNNNITEGHGIRIEQLKNLTNF